MTRVYKLRVVPSTADYVNGLSAIRPRMNDIQVRLLQSQYRAPRRTVTATKLAELAGVEGGHPVVNACYGRLGRLFCEALTIEPDFRSDGTSRWWAMWSLGYSTAEGFQWEMLPEVAESLELLGWVAPGGPSLPEEVYFSERFVEGAACRVVVNAYERNAAARMKCIEHFGTACTVCGFDFGATYGPFCEGFIHVHHLKPLGEIGEAYEVNPITDLRPVCPNCHAVIHRRTPAYSIEQVQAMLEPARRNGTN